MEPKLVLVKKGNIKIVSFLQTGSDGDCYPYISLLTENVR